MVALVVEITGGLHHGAFHEHIAIGGLELQFGGIADELQHRGGIRHIGDLHTDAIGADALHGALGVALVGQAALNHADGALQQGAEISLAVLGPCGGILHIHAAPQVQSQGQGFGPVGRVGGGHPALEPVIAQGNAGHAHHPHKDGQRQYDSQRDQGLCFAIGAPAILLHSLASSCSYAKAHIKDIILFSPRFVKAEPPGAELRILLTFSSQCTILLVYALIAPTRTGGCFFYE